MTIRFTLVSIYQFLLRKEFLEDLVTGDESWVLYDSNTHRAVRLPLGENPPAQTKMGVHSKKCIFCCFLDSRGMLRHEQLPQRDNHLQHLRTPTSKTGSRCSRETVNLLHVNSMPHVAKKARENVEEPGWAAVPHPPCYPDIAPSDSSP